MAEWIEDVLADAVSKSPEEMQCLAREGLKTARKTKDYRSEVLFASLVDFYLLKPRLKRLRAALRIARNHQKGSAFAHVLCAQARHFEAHGSLQPHWGKGGGYQSLLEDEAFYMGVQRWLRTMEAGKVSPKLLQLHVNTTLLPTLNTKKKQTTIRQAQRWLWNLGY